MKINEILWPNDRIRHIAQHHITPEEVEEAEEACYGKALVLRAKSKGDNPVYYVLGKTVGGRYLSSVIIYFPDGKGYPVTARTMTDKEIRRYNKWRSK